MIRRTVTVSGFSVIAAFLCVLAPPPALAQSSTNGVYGGYVGSSAWFNSMRSSAANQAMLRSLSGRSGAATLPADYIEAACRIVFPAGNPFPKGRIPDLRIRCRNLQADGVERAPFVNEDGSFYTVFKKGQTYDLYWMGYFGGLEKFASIPVGMNGPAQRTFTVAYPTDGATTDVPAAPDARRQPVAIDEAPGGHGVTPDRRWQAPRTDARDPRQAGPPAREFEEQLLLEAIRDGKSVADKLGLADRLVRYYQELLGETGRPREETLPRQNREPVDYRVPVSAPQPGPAPAPAPVDVNRFDLAGFPTPPTTFEEQLVLEAIRSATTPSFKAEAHEKLARYYERKGEASRAQTERAKAEYWRAAAR